MVNVCFFNWKGTKPLGGIMPFLGMIPLSWTEIDNFKPDFTLLQKTPVLISIGGKDTNLPEAIAKQSYTYYYHHLYKTDAGKTLYKSYNNPVIYPDVANINDLALPDVIKRNNKFLNEYLNKNND